VVLLHVEQIETRGRRGGEVGLLHGAVLRLPRAGLVVGDEARPGLLGFVDEQDVVRITTNLVQVDAVVTRDGKQVTDLKPEDVPLQPWAAALYQERIDNNGKDHPGVRCLPSGIPEKNNIPDGLKVVQTPDVLIFLYESRTIYRQVFTDGRPLPKDAQPTWMGYSIGRWDKDTFIVDTIGQNGKTWLDMRGLPGTDALHVIERYTRPTIGRMKSGPSDSEAFTKCPSSRLRYISNGSL